MRRNDITSRIIQLLPQEHRPTTEQAVRVWYKNIRAQGGFRLTEKGYQQLQQLDLTSWSVAINPRDLSKTALLQLDRRLTWPYYLDTRRRRLVLFSSREAMMATLYGDLEQWLRSLG